MSQFRRCPTCGKEIASNAWKCPYCGHSFTGEKASINAKAGCLTVVLVGGFFFLLLLIMISTNGH